MKKGKRNKHTVQSGDGNGKGYPGWNVVFSLLLCTIVILWKPIITCADVEIPTPTWLEGVPIADKMIINSLPSKVYSFEADRTLDELFGFYRQRWANNGEEKAGYRESDAEPWHVIAKLDGRYLFTVQARQRDPFTIEGYLAVGDLKAVRKNKEPAKNIPKMRGSRLVNDLTSYDPGKKGRTLLLLNTFSVASNSDFYRKYYLGRGWGQVMDQGSNNAQVLAFTRFGKEAHLVISRPGRITQVVMNLIENN